MLKQHQEFHNNLENYGYYITHEIQQEKVSVVSNKILRCCKYMVVHIICVTVIHAENESSSVSSSHLKCALILYILGDNSVNMQQYDKKLFNTRALLEWVAKMYGLKNVH